MLAALSCVRELPLPNPESDSMEGKVKIYFSLPVSGEVPSTKGLGEGNGLGNGGLKTLYVAVYGSSGYLKEYVKAENLGESTETYSYTDAYGQEQQVPLIDFSVTLSLSPKPRFVHILGNCPADVLSYKDTSELFTMFSGENEPAYWQIIDLPNGIGAKVTGDQGQQQYEKNLDGTYRPDDVTRDAFTHLFLIRNWAKLTVHVDSGAQFELEKFALVNLPKKGTLAPSITDNDGQCFVRNYNNKRHPDLVEMGFEGVLPEDDALYNRTIPSATDFTGSGTTSIPIYDNGQEAYLYERPVPVQIPTFVIVYGTYTGDGAAKKCYYKIDLSDDTSGDNKYYPIFRNFQYEIRIHKIESAGYDNPQDAANSPGSISVSADTRISGFADISDGTARLAVQPWMAKSYNRTDFTDQLFVKFFSDISQEVNLVSDGSNTADPVLNPVTFELISRGEGMPDLIEILPNENGNRAFFKPDENQASDNYGWRELRFKTASSLPSEKSTQTLRVKGVYTNAAGAPKTLYRDIQITLLPSQTMYVWCTKTDLDAPQTPIETPDLVNPITVTGATGTPLYLNMALPKELPKSMFPLEFYIEPEEMTLTPNTSGKDLPVVSRETISDKPRTANAFQYIRNLEWDEYNNAREVFIQDEEYALVTCAFLTNRCECGTKIWVDNEFFNKASTSFEHTHEFSGLSFLTYIPKTENGNVKFRFEVEKNRTTNSYPQKVIIVTEGMQISSFTGLSGSVPGQLEQQSLYSDGKAVYFYTPSEEITDFTCKTKVITGDVAVSVEGGGDGYTKKEIQSHHFTVIGFVDGIQQSNVVYGKINHNNAVDNLAAPFGYCHEPGYPTSVNVLNLNDNNRFINLNYNYNSTTLSVTSITNYPKGVDSTYHEIGFKTNKEKGEACSFRLVANGYAEEAVEATRFTGGIGTVNFTKNDALKATNTYGLNEASNWTFTYSPNDTISTKVSFGQTDAGSTIGFNSNGLKLKPKNGSSDTFTVTVNSEFEESPLYFVEIVFNKEPKALSVSDQELGAKVIRSRSVNSTTSYRYLWTLPQNPLSPKSPTTLSIETNTNQEITIQQIIIKAVKYTD